MQEIDRDKFEIKMYILLFIFRTTKNEKHNHNEHSPKPPICCGMHTWFIFTHYNISNDQVPPMWHD
jgi:hypothetical protein